MAHSVSEGELKRKMVAASATYDHLHDEVAAVIRLLRNKRRRAHKRVREESAVRLEKAIGRTNG